MSENRSLTLAANTNDQTVFQGKECLTPWDVQSNRIQSADGVAAPLYSGEGQGTHNGAVLVPQTVYPLEGNGVRESHRGPGYSESDKMFTLNTVERHAVAYCIQGNMVDRETKQRGSGIYEDRSCTLTAVDRHAVACESMSIVGQNQHSCIGIDIYNCQQTGNKACSVTTSVGMSQGSVPKVMTSELTDSCYAETCGGKQTVGSLCAHDGRGFNGQDVANDKLIIEHYETENNS